MVQAYGHEGAVNARRKAFGGMLCYLLSTTQELYGKRSKVLGLRDSTVRRDVRKSPARLGILTARVQSSPCHGETNKFMFGVEGFKCAWQRPLKQIPDSVRSIGWGDEAAFGA